MKAFFCGVGLLVLLSLGCATASSSSNTGCRLTVELRDGSRVVGTAEEKHFDFHSDILGDMKLPLEKIRSLEATTKTNVIKISTVGGDSLMADFAMEQIHLATSYGGVKLPVSLIKNVRVSALGKAGRPMDGLIGLWSAEGNAVDSVSGESGILRNVSFTDGVAGQAFSFAPNSFPYGTYTGVQIPDKPAYALTEVLTIEGWVRSRGDGYVIFYRGDHRPGLDPYCLSMQHGHVIRFQITGRSNEDTAYVDANIPYCKWTHVAAVLNGDDNTISLYTNGVLAAQIETQVRPMGDLIPELSPGIGIGNVNDGGNNFPYIGDIDEIALYNRALSADEINAIYSEHAANAGGRCELLPMRAVPPAGMPMRQHHPIYNLQ